MGHTEKTQDGPVKKKSSMRKLPPNRNPLAKSGKVGSGPVIAKRDNGKFHLTARNMRTKTIKHKNPLSKK